MQFHDAQESFRHALDIQLRLGMRSAEAGTYGNLANLALQLMEWQDAKALIESALEIHYDLGEAQPLAQDHIISGQGTRSNGQAVGS